MNEVTKELLLDYHAGRATTLQRRLIEDWLQDARNRPVYYDTLIEWETTHPQYVADVTVGLKRYRNRMAGDLPTVDVPLQAVTTSSPFRWFTAGWLVAACVAVVLVLTGVLFRETIQYKTYATGNGQLQHVTLWEGSRVVLNGNSTLRVNRFGPLFPGKQREVFLTGEAEFSVTHQHDNRRFVVHTRQQLDVEVLGTEFVVLARERATRVVLMRGKVKLRYQGVDKGEKILTMAPGQKATLHPRQQALTVAPAPRPEDYSAWKNRQYVFNDTPLTEIGRMIQDDFGLKVEIKEAALGERQVSGTYNVAEVEELLSALQELLSIRITRHRDRVILSQQNH